MSNAKSNKNASATAAYGVRYIEAVGDICGQLSAHRRQASAHRWVKSPPSAILSHFWAQLPRQRRKRRDTEPFGCTSAEFFAVTAHEYDEVIDEV